MDLSDGWAPAIFQDGESADGRPLPNRYRAIFVGLAADRTDGDGQPLRLGEGTTLARKARERLGWAWLVMVGLGAAALAAAIWITVRATRRALARLES